MAGTGVWRRGAGPHQLLQHAGKAKPLDELQQHLLELHCLAAGVHITLQANMLKGMLK